MKRTTDEQRQLAELIAKHPDLYTVVSRHGLTEHDLLDALRNFRERGGVEIDLWALVRYAARAKGSTLVASD